MGSRRLARLDECVRLFAGDGSWGSADALSRLQTIHSPVFIAVEERKKCIIFMQVYTARTHPRTLLRQVVENEARTVPIAIR